MRLDGKVVVITGAARGQGAAEAELFASEGATVHITDVRADEGKQLADSLGDRVTFHEHDVSSAGEWAELVDDVLRTDGHLDVLVNNAGIAPPATLLTTTEETYRRIFEVNQLGTFLGMQAVSPHMVERGSGSIVNISSTAGLSASSGFAYGATKFAIRGMTKSAAVELAKSGVRVNAICPGLIHTPMLEDGFKGGFTPDFSKVVPLGRAGSAQEVAYLALYLASDESAYCTGQDFVIDGGVLAQGMGRG